MPGFDFSNCSLVEWSTPLPSKSLALFIDKASWDHGKFEIRVTSVVVETPLSQQYWHRYSITCEPVFAVLFADEAMATSLWERSHKLGTSGNHLIVSESDWVKSFKKRRTWRASATSPPWG